MLRNIKILLEEQKKDSLEIINALEFHTAINGKSWIKEIGFNLTEWSADYKLLTYLFRILNDFKPQNILEFGMGETTKMLSAYVTKYNREAKAYTVEHDDNWIKFFAAETNNLDSINVIKTAMVKAPIKGTETNYYENLISQISSYGKFELVVIDGPIGSEAYSRYNACDLVESDLLADKFVMLFDDAHRAGEKQTINDLELLLNKKEIKYSTLLIPSSEKDICLIFSEDYKFLASN